MKTNKHMTADSCGAMVPSILDPPKRNEVIVTREEAKKKKVPKGYAYVPVSNPPSDAVGDLDGRRTRHTQLNRLDSGSSAQFDVKSISGDQRAGGQSATGDARGMKRKSMSVNVDALKGNELSGDGGPLSAGSGDGGHSAEDLKRKKEEKRMKREKLREELKRIMAVNAKIEEREQVLRTRATASASESAGESRKRTEYGDGKGNGKWPNITVDIPSRMPMGEEGGETAQSEMTRQASYFSDATPGAAGKEKRTPKANTVYINPDFVSGRDKLPPPEKQKPKVVGLKRGGKTAENRIAKRQRSEAAHARRLAEIMKMCTAALKRLRTHKFAWVFDKPVDVVKLNLPDYFQVIKRPMDLGTVDSNLKQGRYEDPAEFYGDVKLVFSNAMTYNPPGNDVYFMANEMQKLFESSYKKIAEKIKEDEFKSLEDEDDVNTSTGKEVQELHRRLKRLESQVEMKEKKPQTVSAIPSGKTPALPKPRKEDTQKRPMTFEEKSKLSVGLGKLPGDKLGKIVQIISSKQPNLSHEDDEIELDIDSMDNDTLWELARYVSNVMKSKNKGKRKAEEDGQRWTQSRPDAQLLPANKKGEGKDEVDIVDEMPRGPIAPVEIERDAKEGASSSGSSSSDDTGSTSTGSESGSGGSSGSESEADDAQGSTEPPPGKETINSGATSEPKGSPAKTDGAKRTIRLGEKERMLEGESPMNVGEASGLTPVNASSNGGKSSKSPVKGSANQTSSDVSPPPAPVLTGEAATRAALLRDKYADLILNAQKKAALAPSKSEKLDSKKLEEMERRHKEERARLAKEAKEAQEARRRQEEVAQAAMRKQRELEREAARRALQEMERTVNLNENTEVLKDLRGLSSVPDFHPSAGRSRPISPSHTSNEEGVPPFNTGGKLLETLGFYMKDDDDGDDQGSEYTDTLSKGNAIFTENGVDVESPLNACDEGRERDKDAHDTEEGEVGMEFDEEERYVQQDERGEKWNEDLSAGGVARHDAMMSEDAVERNKNAVCEGQMRVRVLEEVEEGNVTVQITGCDA